MSYRTGTRNLQWGKIELSRISYILNLISTFLLLSLHGATAGRLLVTEGIIHPLVSVSARTWFVRSIYY